jgi:hypothetical protein
MAYRQKEQSLFLKAIDHSMLTVENFTNLRTADLGNHSTLVWKLSQFRHGFEQPVNPLGRC